MAEKIEQVFGKRVRALRKQKDWSQNELAAHAKISRQHLSTIELAQREVCLHTIGRLAEALEVSPTEFFR